MPGKTSPEMPVHRTLGKSKVFNSTSPSSYCGLAPLLTDRKCRDLLRLASRTERKYLAAIRKAVQRGEMRLARKIMERYFLSYHCKFVALYEANRSCKPPKRLMMAILARQAQRLSLRHRCSERAVVFEKIEASGKRRLLIDFGPLNRARQLMVMKGLRAFHAYILPDQYAVAEGRDACVQALTAKMQTEQSQFVSEVDIRDFFGSIDPERLRKEIGLSNKVIRCVVSISAYTLRYKHVAVSSLKCLTGIPQGAVCSPLIAAVVVDRVVRSFGLDRVVNYADNICVVAKTERELQTRAQTLISALQGSRHGTLRVTKKDMHAATGIDFLGYRIRAEDNVVEIEPKEKCVIKVQERLIRTAKDIRRPGLRRRKVYAALKHQLDNWLAAFRLTNASGYSFMLRRMCEYLSQAKVKGKSANAIGASFDRWNEDLTRALSERGFGSRKAGLLQRPRYATDYLE